MIISPGGIINHKSVVVLSILGRDFSGTKGDIREQRIVLPSFALAFTLEVK